MEWGNMHADRALLPRGQFLKRTNIHLRPKIELASSLIEFLLDELALLSVLLAVLVLTILAAIPDTLAPVAIFECITLLTARRAAFGWGLILLGRFDIIILRFRRFSERHGTELLGSRIKFLLDALAFFFMLASMTLLTSNVAIPNTLAGRTPLDGVTLLAARRTQLLGRGPVFGVGFLAFHRFTDRH